MLLINFEMLAFNSRIELYNNYTKHSLIFWEWIDKHYNPFL